MKEYMELRNFLKRGMTEYPKTRNAKHGARIKLQFLVKDFPPLFESLQKKTMTTKYDVSTARRTPLHR